MAISINSLQMTMMDETDLLKEISHKLSQLIVLTKLTNATQVKSVIEEIKKDQVAQIAIAIADGSLTSSQVKQKVTAQTNVSERTVQRRLAELVEKGVLIPVKRGNELYYEDSGLFF